jgi:hypothetical protein
VSSPELKPLIDASSTGSECADSAEYSASPRYSAIAGLQDELNFAGFNALRVDNDCPMRSADSVEAPFTALSLRTHCRGRLSHPGRRTASILSLAMAYDSQIGNQRQRRHGDKSLLCQRCRRLAAIAELETIFGFTRRLPHEYSIATRKDAAQTAKSAGVR